MLKNIPTMLSPELLKVLMEMGHGDEIVIGDGNFPAASTARKAGVALIRCDGQNVPELLTAIMQVFPLDQYAEAAVFLMDVVAKDRGVIYPKRWREYQGIIAAQETVRTVGMENFGMLERFDFYARAEQACAVISTGDPEIYANIILKKGVITK